MVYPAESSAHAKPSRRSFLALGSIALLPALACAQSKARFVRTSLAAQALGSAAAQPDTDVPAAFRFCALTDIHYADAPDKGTRFYRDSLTKVQQAVKELNDRIDHAPESQKPSLCFMLGDLIDSRKTPIDQGGIEEELAYLATIETELAKLHIPRHYVYGNHCVYTLTKPEFAAHTVAQPSYYSFDRPFASGSGSLHIVILDACFTSKGKPYGRRNFVWSDANIPQHELDWLKADLAATEHPTLIFTHQRLDSLGGPLTIHNAKQVRPILRDSGKVLAVFQGHSHENSLTHYAGIPFLVFRAVVEGPGAKNNAYAMVDVFPDLSMMIHGHGKQLNQRLPYAPHT